MDGPGFGFWAKLIGVCVAAALGGILVWMFIGWAWFAWGLLGVFIFFGAVALTLGWIVDRRNAKRDRELMA